VFPDQLSRFKLRRTGTDLDLLLHCFSALFNLFSLETLFHRLLHANMASEIDKAGKTTWHAVKHCFTGSNNVSGEENLCQAVLG
jgi:hypothetical protein